VSREGVSGAQRTSSEEEQPTVARMFRRLLEEHPAPAGRPYKLTEIARATGLPVSYLRDLRNGAFAMPTLDRAQRLADFFGVAPRYLLGYEEQMTATAEVQVEPDGRQRLTVRLDEGHYRPLADLAHRWSVPPTELLHSIVSTVLGDLEAVTPTVRQNSRLGLVTVDAVLQALVVVYERQRAAYDAEIRRDDEGGGVLDGRRDDDAGGQPATQQGSRRRRTRRAVGADGADQAEGTG